MNNTKTRFHGGFIENQEIESWKQASVRDGFLGLWPWVRWVVHIHVQNQKEENTRDQQGIYEIRWKLLNGVNRRGKLSEIISTQEEAQRRCQQLNAEFSPVLFFYPFPGDYDYTAKK